MEEHVCSEVQQRRPPYCRFMARLTVNDPSQSTLEVSAIFSLTCCKHAGACAFRFSEPFSTDADPTSHRVRLWRGGLRPKFYFLIYTCLEYIFTDALKNVNAPGSFCGAEGKGGVDQLCLFSRTGVVSLILLVFYVVPKRCRLIICPVGQRLWRPVLHVGFSMYLCILFTYGCFQLGSSASGKLL